MSTGPRVDPDRVQERIDDNLDLVGRDFIGHDRTAARHLFSTLRHLEQIAVMAAERGDSIEGQLEDEYVHRGTFEALANRYGGLLPPCDEVQRLVDYLTAQEGDMSLAMLNVVAESWLETVFGHIGSWGYVDALMAVIEEDEERHVHDALEMAKPDPEQAEPTLRELEKMLSDIAQSAAFMLPLIYFGGEEAVCAMGMDLCAAHERGCRHLGIEPNTHQIRLFCRAQRLFARTKPEALEMHEGQVTLMRLYPELSPMLLWFDMPFGTSNGGKIQAQVATALACILARYPELRTVTRRGQLYRVQDTTIALRTAFDEYRPANVFVTNGQYKIWQETLTQMRRRTKRLRAHTYRPVPDLGNGLADLLPPSRCAVAVNFNGQFGGIGGTGPLSDIEGIPTLVTIGEPRPAENGYVATVTILMDHRCGAGRHIGALKRELETELALEEMGV